MGAQRRKRILHDSSEEEEEGAVNVHVELSDSQSVQVGGGFGTPCNPALDGRDQARPMQDIITLTPTLPDFHPVNNQLFVFFNRLIPLRHTRLMIDCTNSNLRNNQSHVDMAEMDQFMSVVL